MSNCFKYRVQSLILLFILIGNYVYSQSRVQGFIQNEQNKALSSVNVYIKKQNTVLKTTITDSKGNFFFKDIKRGHYTLLFELLGYESLSMNIDIDENPIYDIGIITLYNKIYDLEGITITGENEATKIRKNPMSVAVLETKNIERKSLSSADIMGTISGVNIRQKGGLGSDTEVSINGMSGKQVRFFLDGIPLNYYGNEFNIAAMPQSFFSRLEVYKGNIPIQLAADALGGAVNFVSSDSKKKQLNVNYGIGSFNTHKFGLNGFYKTKNDYYIRLNAFFNHSDNNYIMNDVEIIDKNGNVKKGDAERFHNKFNSYFIETQLGVTNKTWADRAFISVYGMGSKYELQHNTLATQVYGEAYGKGKSIGVLGRYTKKNIIKNLDFELFGLYRLSNPKLIDISSNIYNWEGNTIARKQTKGEISTLGLDLNLDDKNVMGQINLTWNISNNVKLKGTFQRSHFKRKGIDFIAKENNFKDLNELPKFYDKNIAGLSFEIRLLSNSLRSISFLKHYKFESKGYENKINQIINISNYKKGIGYGQAFAFELSKSTLFKISYENSLRLPSIYEIFGNLDLVLPNYSLKPERSHNINLGFQYKYSNINLESNLFYRKTKDIIWLRPSTLFAQHQNIFQTETRGIDAELSYRFLNSLKVNLNATWQDIRNKSNIEASEKYLNKRLPNIPYFFGNLNFSYFKKNIFELPLNTQFWYGFRYVEQFYLFWEGDGRKDLKNIIPRQYPNYIGFSLSDINNKYKLTFECQNLFNQKIYDNFKLQKPGRAFYLTLNYNLTK